MDTKKLRQKILDLAIHGKLVPQDPNDEPASVLLERIRAEKERLVKEGKIKKSKASKTTDTPHYENVPFEVPSSWEWCKLGDVCTIKGGKRIPRGKTFSKEKTNHIYLRVTDMKDNTIIMSDLKYIDDEVFSEIKSYIINSSDLYLTIAGTIGAVGTIPEAVDGMNLTENAAKLTNISCNKMYLMYSLLSTIAQEHFSSRFHQVAQPKLSIETANQTPIPLPPIAEQKRIVTEIERWFALIDQIEQGKANLQATIKQAKSKILDLAIHGKLVSQDPNDEPASELLKRINPKAEITCDNGLYGKLPEGWVMINIAQISELLSGRDLTNKDCNGNEEGIPYLIGASNIVNNQLNITRWTNKPQVISSKGDILISCKGTIGEIIINNIGDIHIARQFMAIRSDKDCIETEYFLYYLFSMVHNIKENARGVIPGISREDILTKCLPLPPLSEQQRIVNAIDKAFANLDKIMESL